MALGGGLFNIQNKVLNGSYINFVSAKRASLIFGDRGFAAMPLELDWGVEDEVFTVESSDFQKDSMKIFGYSYDHEKLKGLRDLFKNTKTLYAYKLNAGVKAANDYATAKYGGIRGNDLKIIIQKNVDDETKFDVSTLIDNAKIDVQIVANASELVDNDYVVFKKDATLTVTAGMALTGGTNGAAVTGLNYQTFLSKIEGYSFNTLGCTATTDEIKNLFIAFTKRMRDEIGAKFQTVLYDVANADYIGIISVKNRTTDENYPASSAVYFTTGIEAGCLVNKSCTNKKYTGEFTIEANYTQTQLINALKAGEFVYHKVGDDVRILDDINTYITYTEDMNSDFNSNQTIRVLDQIGNDIAVLFNTKYLGEVPNDGGGRISLWNDIVKHHQEMEKIRAIENFDPEVITVEKGETKKSVVVTDSVEPTNAMGQLYMTVIVQ